MQNSIFTPNLSIETLKNELLKASINDDEVVNFRLRLNALISNIDYSLTKIEQSLQPRKNWPNKLRFFPFNLKIVQKLALRAYELLFREHRDAQIQMHKVSQNLLVLNKELLQFINTFLEQKEKNRKKQDSESHDLYVNLTESFRGPAEEIKKRQAYYLPYIKDSQASSVEFPVLDLASGRGEWLELLKENGFHAKGVDLNHHFVKNCREAGLVVEQKNLMAYLVSLPADSLGAVTAFHIIEHLPFNELFSLFEEVKRVLRPGGLAIFETPNPENVFVGSCTFYLDPTHRHPLPKDLVKFLLQQKGFKNIQCVELSPHPEEVKLQGSSDIAESFNKFFYCGQDYAVFAYK
jgi:SAM-dependent methyltransferase